MVKLNSSSVFVKDPIDVWGKEQTIGLSELAVRTHAAAMPFDRRGDVIAWDDFESSTKRYSENIYGTGTIARSTDTAKTGTFSLKHVTGATTDNYCFMAYMQSDFHLGKLGSQISFASDSDNYVIWWDGSYYDGTYKHTAGIKWTESTEKLSYLGDDAVWHDLPGTYEYYASITNWATLKVVCDISTNYYVRVLFGNDEIDLSDYAMRTQANANKRVFVSTFETITKEDVAKTAYLDNYILTENEPA